MKFFIKLIVTIGIVIGLGLISPFWGVSLGLVALNIFYNTSVWSSFFSGFMGMAITWGTYAYLLIQGESALIHEKISTLFGLEENLLWLVIVLLAGILGGLSAWAGFSIRNLGSKKRKNPYYR